MLMNVGEYIKYLRERELLGIWVYFYLSYQDDEIDLAL